MDVGAIITIVALGGGFLVTLARLVPKIAKIAVVGKFATGAGESLARSYGPGDDTPGKVTPAEWAEALGDGIHAMKDELKDV